MYLCLLRRLRHWPELRRCCEWFVLCDGEDEQEALATAEIVIPDGCVVFLTRRVQNVNLHVLAVQHHLLPVAVGFGGLVVLHELRAKTRVTWLGRRNSTEGRADGKCSSRVSPRHTWTAGLGLTSLHRRCPPWSPCGEPESSGFCSYQRPWLWSRSGGSQLCSRVLMTCRDQQRSAGKDMKRLTHSFWDLQKTPRLVWHKFLCWMPFLTQPSQRFASPPELELGISHVSGKLVNHDTISHYMMCTFLDMQLHADTDINAMMMLVTCAGSVTEST